VHFYFPISFILLFFIKSFNSSSSGMALEQATFVTTIAAHADPFMTALSIVSPCNNELIKPPLKASPAPVGFRGVTGKIPKFLL
jgi:hypothetical protein